MIVVRTPEWCILLCNWVVEASWFYCLLSINWWLGVFCEIVNLQCPVSFSFSHINTWTDPYGVFVPLTSENKGCYWASDRRRLLWWFWTPAWFSSLYPYRQFLDVGVRVIYGWRFVSASSPNGVRTHCLLHGMLNDKRSSFTVERKKQWFTVTADMACLMTSARLCSRKEWFTVTPNSTTTTNMARHAK